MPTSPAPLLRLSCASLLCALALLLLPAPSRAGAWIFTLTGTATETGISNPATGPSDYVSYSFTNTQAKTAGQGGTSFTLNSTPGNSINCALNYTSTGPAIQQENATLSVTAMMTWTPSYPGDT